MSNPQPRPRCCGRCLSRGAGRGGGHREGERVFRGRSRGGGKARGAAGETSSPVSGSPGAAQEKPCGVAVQPVLGHACLRVPALKSGALGGLDLL